MASHRHFIDDNEVAAKHAEQRTAHSSQSSNEERAGQQHSTNDHTSSHSINCLCKKSQCSWLPVTISHFCMHVLRLVQACCDHRHTDQEKRTTLHCCHRLRVRLERATPQRQFIKVPTTPCKC